jgi:hypothetical protein
MANETQPVNGDQNGTAPKRLMPSNSTLIGGVGGAGLAPIVVWITSVLGLEMDAGTAAAFGALIGNILGYFFDGGRR